MGAAPIPSSALNLQNGRPAQSIASLYDLISAQVTIPGNPAQMYSSPLSVAGNQQTLLPQVVDQLTTVRGPEIPARINVNTAPVAVLSTLPGLQPSDVQNILSMRPSPASSDPPDPMFQTPAWLVLNAHISPTTMKTLEPYITARSQVYRAQVIGYFDRKGPVSRLDVIIDTNQGQPRFLYYRDLTELGRGFHPKDIGATGN
jgi:hypothetical protein